MLRTVYLALRNICAFFHTDISMTMFLPRAYTHPPHTHMLFICLIHFTLMKHYTIVQLHVRYLHPPASPLDSEKNKTVNLDFNPNTAAQVSLPLLLIKAVSDQNCCCWLNNVGLKHDEMWTVTSLTVLEKLLNPKATPAKLFFGQNICFHLGRESQKN